MSVSVVAAHLGIVSCSLLAGSIMCLTCPCVRACVPVYLSTSADVGVYQTFTHAAVSLATLRSKRGSIKMLLRLFSSSCCLQHITRQQFDLEHH